MPPKIPTEADFTHLNPPIRLSLTLPSPPESTTTFLILLHGFGDNEAPFTNFARSMKLPGVACLSVRGTSVLQPSLLGEMGMSVGGGGGGGGGSATHFHWGDDVRIDPSTGDIDPDPGFSKATENILEKIIKETIIDKLGWEMDDIILFGFGQGGSLALGLASTISAPAKVEDVTEGSSATPNVRGVKGRGFKSVISLGGALPISMVSTISSRRKSKTRVLLCQVDEEGVDGVKREFEDVRVVRWKRRDVDMPRDREEMYPIMSFLAESLRNTVF